MPLRDLPPSYPLDPALVDPIASLMDRCEEYLAEAIECCEALRSRDDPNDLIAAANSIIAAQVNVAAEVLRRGVEQVAPERAKTLTHDYLVQRVMTDVVKRALEAHLTRRKDIPFPLK